MDKAMKAIAALDRIFDRCEEIDNGDGYSMLDDIRAVSGYIDSRGTGITIVSDYRQVQREQQ